MFTLAVYYYNQLPQIIPIHFNASGEPDGYGNKSFLWIMPGIEVVLYISMLVLSRYPHLFNYPATITEENAHDQYQMGARLLRAVNLATAIIFCYITFSMIQSALNNKIGLSGWFMPIVLIVIFGILVFYFIKVFNHKKTQKAR